MDSAETQHSRAHAMKVAVVGGGINGIMSAWALAQRGHNVTLFERDSLMGATSSHSTKLLHGGLRYLEHGQIRFVREALRERIWWLHQAPDLAHPVELVLPVYRWSRRSRWKIGAGLMLYDFLAGQRNLAKHKWYGRDALLRLAPELKPEGLRGGFTFCDGQMDDRMLGLWAAEQARAAGVDLREGSAVTRITRAGEVEASGTLQQFDRVVNAAGPWAAQLLDQSGIQTRYRLDLVRGSHLLLRSCVSRGYVLEMPGEERICFVLPYKGRSLVGTTEVRQSLADPIRCSDEERDYLLKAYNEVLTPPITVGDIEEEFAGLRPLIRSSANASRSSRECAIEKQGKLVNAFGGKWTTARALGKAVASVVVEGTGKEGEGG